MKSDLHERARMLISLSEAITRSEQSWLAAHLESCASCRDFAESMAETIRSLRAVAITADGNLVSATQRRVRQRAEELHKRQERLWVIWTCSAAVTLSTAFSTLVLWRGLAWMGQQARLSAPGLEIGFVALCLMPALVTGILLLARGTYLADQ